MTSKYFVVAFLFVFALIVNGDDDGSAPPCLDLTGITTFLDNNNNGVSVVQTQYISTPIGLNFTASGLLMTEDRTFEIGANGYFGCDGSAKKPCSVFFAIATADFEIDIDFYSYYASGYMWAADLIVNKVIRKNGFLMKNPTEAFTPDDPCISSMPTDNFYGTPSEILLCCTRFQQPSSFKVADKHDAMPSIQLPPRRRPKFVRKAKPDFIVY